MSAPQSRQVFKKTTIAQLVAQLFFGGLVMGVATPASAAGCTWNAAAGNWAALANWTACVTGNGNPIGTPGSSDAAAIGALGVVTINTGQSVLTLNNAGQINIDAFGLNLVGGGSTTNSGTINVGGASTANLGVSAGHNINNTGGVINIADGSVVNQFGSTISGGTISTTSAGELVAFNSNSNILDGVTLNGTLNLSSNTGIERVSAGLTLNGAVNVNQNSVLSFTGDQTLGGTGTVVLGNTGGSNRALSMEGNTVLTIGSGVVVRGENGTIGQAYLVGGTQSLVNNGRISADVAGGSINLAPSHGITNHGVLEALNGGTLVLNSAVNGQLGSSINAGAASTVLQNGVALSGVINTSGSGAFRAANSNSNFLNGVTFNGVLDLQSATGIERVSAGLTLNGAVNVNQNSVLSFTGDQTLGGTGTVVLGNTGGSNRALSMEGNTVLTIGSGVVVRGENGTIGQAYLVGGTQSLVNNGRISADVAGGSISLAASGGVTNGGLLEAQNGGTLVLNSNVSGLPGGSILAGAGSTVLQNGVTLSGVINSAGSGNFQASNNNNNFLNGATVNGPLDLATGTGIERVLNGLTLNGTINVNNNSVLSFSGNQTLAGNGNIVLGNTGASNRALSMEGNTVLSVGSGIAVSGENGTVGQAYLAGGTQTLANNGSIQATVGGGTVALAAGLTQNSALLGAANGGTLRLDGEVNQSGVGQINAANGSNVIQNGITITGGAINSVGSGRLTASNSNNNFLSGVTLGGLLDLASATGIERVVGGLTLNGGSVSVNNNSVLSFNGDQTLGGSGSIVLGNTGASNRALSLEGNTTLTIGSGVAVRGTNGTLGQAYLAGGAQNIINNGTINSDGGGTITITPTAIINNGLIRAQNGTLTNQAVLTGTGTLQVDVIGAMNLANGAKTQGQLAMGATGAALNLGTGNLTITGDYTNVGAGTGNSFNKRAGVTGTGQIVAGGDAAQAITGTGVTNGSTANATLTLGNVRVGATTFNYQVANTGVTGPSLRGAIQTNVNGANLTDARLGGAGVTASNYNTGAPGGNTGNLGVTFTAASAGLLAPLSGQLLNLRSNFENIADQKLNIVLGAGAAAFNAAIGNATPSPVQVANQRIGGLNTAVLTVTNTAAPGAFSEDLNASFGASTGTASGSGSIAGRLAGTNNTGTGAMTVAVNTASAGAKTGTVTLNYQTAGAVGGVSNGLGATGAGSQVITVNGNVFQAATGAIQTAALNFGTVQVGQVVSQNLIIRNTATGASGFVEDLNASFGASSGTDAGLISGSGSLSGILAGTNSTAANGLMTVAVNTLAAGTVNGGIAVNYLSAGAVGGVSNGLGTAGAGSETFGVNGVIQTVANVINQASPLVNNPAINLGNVRVGAASPSAFVSVTNQATVSPQAALNASISGNALITGSGSFNLLNPGATDNNSLQVGMDTNTAGTRNGTATINFVSDASNVGNCAPNCQLNLAPQNVAVTGGVYRLANAQNVTPSVTLAARVGDAAPSGNVSITNQSPDIFTEALKVQAGGAPSGFVVGANPANIAAQGSGAVQVSLNTATAGALNGSLTLNHISTGAGTTNAADLGVGSSIVALSGKVYTAAVSAVQGAVNFGIVHVGDVVAALGVSVQNSAPVTALNDTLRASIGGAGGAFSTNTGVVAGLAAGGAANTTALTVGLSTVTAGIYNGTAFVGLSSQNPDMADLALAAQTVALTGTVNNYANAIFDKVNGAGTLSRVGNQFILDFGTVVQNSGPLSSILDVNNDVLGPADLLNGSLAILDGDDFSSTLLLAGFSGIAAGGSSGDALSFMFDSTSIGSFQDEASMSWFGNNASGFQDQSRLYTLLVRGNVIQQGNTVPEPGTLALLLVAAVGAALARRRRTMAH